MTMIQIGYNSFPSMNSKVAQAAAFTLLNSRAGDCAGTFIDLNSAAQSSDKEEVFLAWNPSKRFVVPASKFKIIPGSPMAYWVSESARAVFKRGASLSSISKPRVGMRTGDNELFLRHWHEVSIADSYFICANATEALESGSKWFPFVKGGDFRKWFGNIEYLINWANNGHEIKKATLAKYSQLSWDNLGWKICNEAYYFRPAITWTAVTSSSFGVRFIEQGKIFGTGGSCIFPDGSDFELLGALLCSRLGQYFIGIGNPTLNVNIEDVAAIPVIKDLPGRVNVIAKKCLSISRFDWNDYERSWDFQSLPFLKVESRVASGEEKKLTTRHSGLGPSYSSWITQNRVTIAEMKRLEEENNRLLIDAYGLADELTPDVPIEQITLTVNPAYRYGKKLADDEWSVEHGFGEELETRFREDTMQELMSYAIGCMMGRYSLDAPGLIYAHSGNQGFDPSRYARFPADADGIIPITDTDWFDDDAAHRLVEFIAVAWGVEEVESDEWRVVSEDGERARRKIDASENTPLTTHHSSLTTRLEENLSFLAGNLSPKKDESSRDTIRRYLSDRFFKDHLQTYKNRPIYWCFTSGKQKAFQCLVYLHRYHEGTLARMRMEYVVPLQSKMAARTDKLSDDIQSASTSAQAKRLQKERDKLVKQLDELRRFDEQLRHYADQRIALDLDDGVKVNYGKFGNLLAEGKTVTGQKSD